MLGGAVEVLAIGADSSADVMSAVMPNNVVSEGSLEVRSHV